MSERREGWYWVKFGRDNDWECKRLISTGYWASHDGVMDVDPSEIGHRIPTPDEVEGLERRLKVQWQAEALEDFADDMTIEVNAHTARARAFKLRSAG